MNRPMGRAPRGEGSVQWFRAVVLIAVLVVVGILILAKTSGSPASKKSAAASTTTTVTTVPSTTTTVAPLPASQVKVQVLNGLQTGSLSSQWNAKLKTYGYQTGPADNATVQVPTSVIYVITPGYQAEAAQLAARVGLTAAAINPTVPAPATAPIPPAERAAANLVLIVGSDLAGQG